MEARFLKLLMEHRAMLHGFIYALIPDPNLAEDVIQETAATLWAKFGEFKEGSFGAWARAVAWRHVAAARRKEWRAHRHVMDDECARRILSAYERREASTDAAAHRTALAACEEGLEPSMREAVELRYCERLSSREIGKKMRRTAQAVDAMIYRTKQVLAECIRRRLAGELPKP
jgi:RNA polymerase sigma-70 factor, ECF subfamily